MDNATKLAGDLYVYAGRGGTKSIVDELYKLIGALPYVGNGFTMSVNEPRTDDMNLKRSWEYRYEGIGDNSNHIVMHIHYAFSTDGDAVDGETIGLEIYSKFQDIASSYSNVEFFSVFGDADDSDGEEG